MAEAALFVLTLAAALGCGLVGGIFFAFSTFVMAALGRLPAGQGAAAMQAINVTVLNPGLLGLFLGTGVLCVALPAASLLGWGPGWGQAGGGLRLAAGLIYLLGSIGVTMAFNVPLNEALAKASPDAPETAGLWARYRAGWIPWNHARTAASALAALLFMAALVQRGSP
jgi:uncharacterized membrane protein